MCTALSEGMTPNPSGLYQNFRQVQKSEAAACGRRTGRVGFRALIPRHSFRLKDLASLAVPTAFAIAPQDPAALYRPAAAGCRPSGSSRFSIVELALDTRLQLPCDFRASASACSTSAVARCASSFAFFKAASASPSLRWADASDALAI